jgi:hypothetical protein
MSFYVCVCVCLSFSLVLHTLGSMSVSHCRFMLACTANTSMRCIFGNEHVIKEKELFFSFFFLYTVEQLVVSHPTLDFSHLDTSTHLKKTIYNDDCFTMMSSYAVFFLLLSSCLSFFFLFFLFHLIILQ